MRVVISSLLLYGAATTTTAFSFGFSPTVLHSIGRATKFGWKESEKRHRWITPLCSQVGRDIYRPRSLPVAFSSSSNDSDNNAVVGNAVILIPSKDADTILSKFGSRSPVPNPSISDAANHLAKKVDTFSDGMIKVHVTPVPKDGNDSDTMSLLNNCNALIGMGLQSSSDVQFLSTLFQSRLEHNDDDVVEQKYKCQFALGCRDDNSNSNTLPSVVSQYDSASPNQLLSTIAPWSDVASAMRLEPQMMDLFERWTSDDFAVALMLFFHRFNKHSTPIPWVQHSIDATWEKGVIQNAQEFYNMATKCGDCIVDCVSDENCKACLDALNEVDTRDQVMSYRTIVSYESELLQKFSFCILQKNNVFGCSATIPNVVGVKPLTKWRGKELTRELAKQILIGHLDDDEAAEGGGGTDVSWKVACGANVAYDQFPSQNQLFYSSVNGRDIWYDPVFRVETIDGRHVWAKRHYKVRHGKVPGSFTFSALDNGVTSLESWNIVGAADDLSWVCFHYAGAAVAVGQRYIGGLLCTRDGSLPPSSVLNDEIWDTLDGCGIAPWELFVVDNDVSSVGARMAGEPPLDFYRKEVQRAKRERQMESVM